MSPSLLEALGFHLYHLYKEHIEAKFPFGSGALVKLWGLFLLGPQHQTLRICLITPLSTEAWSISVFQVSWLGRRRQPERFETMWFSLWICCDWQCGKRGCRLVGLPAASAVVFLRAENIMAFSLRKGKCRARLCLRQNTMLLSLLAWRAAHAGCGGNSLSWGHNYTTASGASGAQRGFAESREPNLSVMEQGTAN